MDLRSLLPTTGSPRELRLRLRAILTAHPELPLPVRDEISEVCGYLAGHDRMEEMALALAPIVLQLAQGPQTQTLHASHLPSSRLPTPDEAAFRVHHAAAGDCPVNCPMDPADTCTCGHFRAIHRDAGRAFLDSCALCVCDRFNIHPNGFFVPREVPNNVHPFPTPAVGRPPGAPGSF